jgi:8-oxo-dGTP pyrophosphatase MutT (NUDIX family)
VNKVSKAIIYQEGRILMLKKSKGWELPGGHLHEKETFEEGLRREVYEETQLTIRNPKPVGGDVDFALFLVTNFTGKIKISKEHKKFKWFTLEQLPSKKLTQVTNKTLPEILQAIQAIQ